MCSASYERRRTDRHAAQEIARIPHSYAVFAASKVAACIERLFVSAA
jgi:hypothetical protein